MWSNRLGNQKHTSGGNSTFEACQALVVAVYYHGSCAPKDKLLGYPE
jgi:hypothetical protein